jgi:membrane protein required for colicin V production
VEPLKDFINPIDIGIIIIFGYCLIRGFFRGFIKELFSLIAVFGGFYAACTYYTHIARLLSRWIDKTAYLNILGFLILFIGIFIIISLLGVLIKYLMNIVFLGWMDRMFGIGFGAIKGVLITSIVLMGLTAFLPNCEYYLKQSKLSPKVTMISESMAELIPTEMKKEFVTKLEACKKAWTENR